MKRAIKGGEGSGWMPLRVNEVFDPIAGKPRLHGSRLLGAGQRLQGFEVSDHS
jgi:hypothetical protein